MFAETFQSPAHLNIWIHYSRLWANEWNGLIHAAAVVCHQTVKLSSTLPAVWMKNIIFQDVQLSFITFSCSSSLPEVSSSNFALLWTGAECCLDNHMPSFSPAWKVDLPWLWGRGGKKITKMRRRLHQEHTEGMSALTACLRLCLCLQLQMERCTKQTNQEGFKKKKAKLLN